GAFRYFGKDDLAVSGASLALALLVCLVVLIRDAALKQRFTEAAGMRGELRRLGLHLDHLGNRLDALETAARPANTAPLVAELEELRQRLGDLAPGHDIEPAPAAPEPAPVSLLDHQLELYLEPIVALANRQTVHYRAQMTLAPPDGR